MGELRHTYHDGIGALREDTTGLLTDAATAVENVTTALLERDPEAGRVVMLTAAEATARVAGIESQVIELLALQQPVARDLRQILAAWRVSQVASLCFGLARSVGARVGLGEDVMTPQLRALAYEIGGETVDLLRKAKGAWVALDGDFAREVTSAAESSRVLQRRFLTELLGLRDVSVEAAVDLGLVARAYERLTDHAVEIADRVIFVG